MDKIYLLIGNDTPLSVCLRKSEGEGDPVPYDLSTAERMRLALVGHGMHVFAEDIEISGEDNNIISGVIPGRSLLKGDYDLEVTFNLDGRDKRFAVKDMFEAVDFLAEDADGEAEGEGAGIFVTVTVQPELIEIAGPTGPQGKSAYQVWLDDGHTGTEDDFFEWLAAQTPNPDWEQNDSSKTDYIKNRTHWEEESSTTINDAKLAWSGSTPEDLDFWFYGTNMHIPRTSAGWGLTWEGGELFIDDMGTGYEIGVFDGEEWSYNPFDPSYDSPPYPLNVDVVIASETVHKLPNKFLDMDTEPTTGSGKPVTSGGVKAAIADFVTRAVNDLLNYYTKTETYTKAEVNQLVAGINNWEIVPVAQLPEASADTMHKIYLVPSSNPKTKNVKDEFITVEDNGSYSWEQIGTTAIDLTNYVTRQELNTALADYVTSAAFTQALALKQDVIADLTQIREGATDTVKYTSQSLTDAQKEQARANIGAASDSEVSQLRSEVDGFIGDAQADLDIADEDGNVLARFEDGDFRVKNFNSALVPQQGENNISPDFAIVDDNGRAIAVFADGHIQTKNFNSNEVARSWFYGKKVSIMGDSISTAPSYNAVEFTVLASDISEGRTLQGYPTYYDIGTQIGSKTVSSSMVGVLTSFTPVSGDAGKTIGKAQNYNSAGTSGVASYTDTWWHKLASSFGMQVLQNVSWSGASISSHEGNDNEYKTSYAWHPAQINKLATRDENGNTIAPDVVIIYRGINDMTHTPYTSLTDFGADATSIPDTDYADSSYDFKVAYCLTIKKIREAYPQTKIVLCTLNVFKRINYTQFPTNNGINTLPEYNNAIREVANMMGCGLIEFDKDGITFENCYPTYISDSSTIPTHPNPTGHSMMAEKAIIDIKKF